MASSALDLTAPAGLRECHGCGLFQTVPALPAGGVARCPRCRTVLRRAHRNSLVRALALNLSALVLLILGVSLTMLRVSTYGMSLSADMLSGPVGLRGHGLWELALVVLFTTVAAPFMRLLGMIYVLATVRLPAPPHHVRAIFRWTERLRPWSMIEVYLLGLFVAYVKLSDIVHIEVGAAIYALGALMLAMVAADAILDPQAVWEAMEHHAPRATELVYDNAVGCPTCGLVSVPEPGRHPACPRCGGALARRKPYSFGRCWALIVTAAMLYVPANIFPVLTVEQFGFGSPSTIIDGARQLLEAGMWPLALLVFTASILIPCLKLLGLGAMLTATQFGSGQRLRDRTALYRLVSVIGRWSMIDIFMESILVALVRFGIIAHIDPGIGAVAFAAVVILTMFAAEAFDPRLMWDAAG